MVEVINPNYIIPPVRVEISSKASGRIRARKVDYIQPNEVTLVKYPLVFKVLAKTMYHSVPSGQLEYNLSHVKKCPVIEA